MIGKDLLSKAMTSVLAGRRLWNQTRGDFYSFLVGAMRSISASWYAQRIVEFGEADWSSPLLDSDETGMTTLDLFATAGAGSDPERLAVANDLLRKCEEALRGDDEALRTIHLLSLGMNAKEITTTLNVSFKAYQAATRRLRRRLWKILRDPQDAARTRLTRKVR